MAALIDDPIYVGFKKQTKLVEAVDVRPTLLSPAHEDHHLSYGNPAVGDDRTHDGSVDLKGLLVSKSRSGGFKSASFIIDGLCNQCVEEQQLDATPIFTREWINVHNENTMYSPSLIERKVTTWEENVCPWWLDYPVGIISKQEIELRERFKQESDEYIEEVQEDSLPPISHGATQVTVGCGSQATPLANKGKGLMEPLGTSRVPIASSMPAHYTIYGTLHILFGSHYTSYGTLLYGGHYILLGAYYFLCHAVFTWA